MGFSFAAVLFAALTNTTHAQNVSLELPGPYALKIHTSSPGARFPINNTNLQLNSTQSSSLFIRDYDSPQGIPWTFNLNYSLPSQPNSFEMLDSSYGLMLLGSKFYAWDPEAPSMQMLAVDLAHVKTGYTGSWPTLYTEQKYWYEVEKVGERWLLQHGRGHGLWIAQRGLQICCNGQTDESWWGIWWWNGTATPEVKDPYVPISIELVSVYDS
ncbi:hypothetical protein BKA65DRAFT_556988 [Rhexocercosporidium sp. MPI-PUGE-AT-0058]|nr:hypothetical protein BKA65DRAFT_556988 [Rhexocercosporidium sp. MPI-PUGE-AT-0058]